MGGAAMSSGTGIYGNESLQQTEKDPHEEEILVSYLTLRRAIGVMGILLPLVLAIGCIALGDCCGVKESISHYYASVMRDVFVGTLFTIGWFLFSYRGFDWKDNLTGDLACVCALGVALFDGTRPLSNPIVYHAHIVSAAAFFLILSYFSICLFTKTNKGATPTHKKKLRNRIYRVCGGIMLLGLVLIAMEKPLFEGTWFADKNPVFWLEFVMLWAFGFSWFIKGETLLKDDPPVKGEIDV
jgi:hypothetical protein